ncbi:hypothetical protein [Campylobacter concisus]|uniref:hypothetical protein n=1 Tax=Campylobacter concisus TaxID=199 RepID=UPI000CD9424F|nr:hypothetical protein [Campylobacter concisus]
MQTLTIRADEALISQIVAISKALANTTNQKLIIDDGYADELNARADEAKQGKGLIDEAQARKMIGQIKDGEYARKIS